MARIGRITCICITMALVTACGRDGSDDRSLVDKITASSFQAPNEFAVLPQKPLVLPDDLAALPAPTPGAGNRTDLTPNADALVAVGGRGDRAAPVASDRALLAATGTGEAGIRRLLAAEDEEFRANNPGLIIDRLFGLVEDGEIYERFTLDASAELLRMRARGVWVPQLPPESDR